MAGFPTCTSRRRVTLASASLMAVGLIGLGLSSPTNANLPTTTFDAGDGNESVEVEMPVETDWSSPAPNLVTVNDAASGTGDNSLSAAEDDWSPTHTLGNIQPNKSDLTRIRVASEKVGARDFMYLAWDRVSDPSGNVAVDFELNAQPQPVLPAPGLDWELNRTVDDLLLTFELVGGGTIPEISLRRWVASGSRELCDTNPSTPCWGPRVLLSATATPAAEGSVNPGRDITFGEMAIDLGLAGIFKPAQCTSFASVYAKSRSSGSGFNSQISDLVEPVETSISNCPDLDPDPVPAIAVTKTPSAATVRGGDAVTYTYTVTNPGESLLVSVGVVDDKCAPVVFAGGDADDDGALDLDEAWTYTCTSVLLETTTNIVNVTGVDPFGAIPTATATATVSVINPAIAIDKTPSAASVEPGTTVVYTYTVTNPGDVALDAVTVVDDKCSPATYLRGDVDNDELLQPGETWVFECSQVQTGSRDTLTNIGTATGVDPLDGVVTATDTVTISVVAPSLITRDDIVPSIETIPAAVPMVEAAPVVLAAETSRRVAVTGGDIGGWLRLAGSLLVLGTLMVAVGVRTPRRRSATT